MKKTALLFAILLIPFVYAQLYADVVFDIKETGEVVISGDTNYEEFQGTTNKLTSKEAELWLLNITSPVLEEFVYEVKLPQFGIINYIKSNTPVRIEEKSGRISITSAGSNKPIQIIVQYTINKEEKDFNLIKIIIGLIVIIVLGLVIKKRLKKQKIIIKKEKKEQKVIKRELYTERQLMILDYLQKHGTVTQAQLERDLKLPKSSLSRNIQTLVQKDIIFKETRGMSNVIGFKE
jgi:uncharacterized membrane protein